MALSVLVATGSIRAANRSTLALPLRAGLLLGCVAASGFALWIGDPSGYLQADPALARLLRGMAVIKGLLALGAVGIVYWRLASPVSKFGAMLYIAGASLLAGSTMLIWQLSYIVAAAVVFHLAALSLLVFGWRDR